MNLLCRLPHLYGQTLLVEGREYFIGDNGVCTDVFEEHGQLLLDQKDVWCLVHPEDLTRPLDQTQKNDRQPDGIEHLTLPPGETLHIPDSVRTIRDDAALKAAHNLKNRKKGKR